MLSVSIPPRSTFAVSEPVRYRSRDEADGDADYRYQSGDLPDQGHLCVQVLGYEWIEGGDAQEIEHPEKAGDSYGDGQPVDVQVLLHGLHPWSIYLEDGVRRPSGMFARTGADDSRGYIGIQGIFQCETGVFS